MTTNADNTGPASETDEHITSSVKHWLDQLVIGLDLCPFAKKERVGNRIRFSVTHDTSEGQLLGTLADELFHLEQHEETETTLLIHPCVLTGFADYNQFLNAADALLEALGLTGTYQIASFHPHYQFADTAPNDAENYTNRSPYPLLHLLRESSVQRAVAQHPDIDSVPLANIEKLKLLGTDAIRQLFGHPG